MYRVWSLDSRTRSISTFSVKLAREYWDALAARGDTPVATRREFGREDRIRF